MGPERRKAITTAGRPGLTMVDLALAFRWLRRAMLAVVRVSNEEIPAMSTALWMALLLAGQPALTDQARILVRRSILEYDTGDYAEALADIKRAYELDPLPGLLFNVGQCHRALRHYREAILAFQSYLRAVPDAKNKETVNVLLEEEEKLFNAELTIPLARSDSVLVLPSTSPPPTATPQPPPMATPPVAKEESVPAAAVEPQVEKSAKGPHSHTAAYVLGSVAVASVVVMVIGIVEVENFQSLVGRLNSPTSYPSYTAWESAQSTATSERPTSQAWQWVAGIAGAVALASGTGAVLTW
jgi:tetratricopeptide (TPR) repeat protein